MYDNNIISKEVVKRTDRVAWLDVTRGIAFLAVIYSHLIPSCECLYIKEIDILFRPMFLTSFFFVSGYLFKSDSSFLKVFEQRTRTLLWPFLCLGILMIAMQHLFTFREMPLPWLDGFKGLVLQNGENELLWFIAALYEYSLAFYWVERWSKNHILIVSFILFVLNWLYTYIMKGPNVPWHFSTIGYGCAYMGLGRWYRLNEERIPLINGIILILVLSVYVSVILWLDDAPSYFAGKYLIDSLAITVIAIYLTICVSKIQWASSSSFLNFIGANSLFYFAFHGKALALVTVLAMYLLGPTQQSLWILGLWGIVCTFLCAFLLIIPALFVNKYCPWLLGKGFRLWKTK